MRSMDGDVPAKKLRLMDCCIKCNEGGNVLICSEIACPIVAHECCLGSPAQFDEKGNFYCPFCVYKLAIEELSQSERKVVLAEKDLSKYVDDNKLANLPVKEDTKTGNIANDVPNQPIGLEKDHVDVPVLDCPTSILQHKEAVVSFGNKENDDLQNKIGDSRILLVKRKNESGPIVVCGHADNDKCCGGEDTADQYQVKYYSKRLKRQGDDNHTITVAPDHQMAERMNAAHIQEQKKSVDTVHKLAQDCAKNANVIEETESRIVNDGQNQAHTHKSVEPIMRGEYAPQVNPEVEAKNQEEAHKTSKPMMCEESAPQVHSEANREVDDTTTSICIDTATISTVVSGVQPPSVGTLRKFSRKSKRESSTSCKSSNNAKSSEKLKMPILKEKRKRSVQKIKVQMNASHIEEQKKSVDAIHELAQDCAKNVNVTEEMDGRGVDDLQNQEHAQKTIKATMTGEFAPQVDSEVEELIIVLLQLKNAA